MIVKYPFAVETAIQERDGTMSHLVKKECSMSDLQTLLDAAKALGWSVSEHERVSYFEGQGEECDYVLHLTGEINDYQKDIGQKYSIGIQVTDGKVQLLHDDAMNGRDVMSNGEHDPCTTRILNKLTQQYQVQRVKGFAKVKQRGIREQKLEGGRIAYWIQGR